MVSKISLKAAHRVIKYMKKREEAIESAATNPQVDIPQSIQEIIQNSWQGDEVNTLVQIGRE